MDAFATLRCGGTGSVTDTTAGRADLAEDNARALEAFLASVERKAFRIAQIALRDADDALDAVQDAMLQLVRRYAARPQPEWKPLFYRILENRVRDQHRRRGVRNRIFAWLPGRDGDADEVADPIAEAGDPAPGPEARLEAGEALAALERALRRLPERQRQAFLLRNFEGLDVAGTATAMGCSEGSVKTHYFRAVHALRGELGEFET
ncbi:MAG: RNA polymerase sigma factor [Gammaproteobacteria bacterium]|nr:RNA polymerase sigma factor [Gammaproteobacteria bacterium]